MSLAIVHSRAALGVAAPRVSVEVHVGGGLPALSIIGLPAAAVRESGDRVRAVLQGRNLGWPAGRIIVHLGPAELPKHGGRFDLAIALGILAAIGELPRPCLAGVEFFGELALDGRLRPVTGAFPAVMAALAAGQHVVLPEGNVPEGRLALAAAPAGSTVYAADDIRSVLAHLKGRATLATLAPADPRVADVADGPDLADVRGHVMPCRALEIAAAGGHNLLFTGPPGTGKSMLAQRLPALLPPLSRASALEVAAVHSVAGLPVSAERFLCRPFRAPHHTASAVALVGGGSPPRPGEVSLAHEGVLFLDELPEYPRRVLEVLREPLENGAITIVRAARRAQFPARCQLIAAMNPCPCGYHGDPTGRCRCTPDQVDRYRARLSGPLLDRIDLHVEVARVNLAHAPPAASSAEVAARVATARARQVERQGRANAWLDVSGLRRHARADDDALRLLARATEWFRLSGRAQARLLKVARTIADLAADGRVTHTHLGEALALRAVETVGGTAGARVLNSPAATAPDPLADE